MKKLFTIIALIFALIFAVHTAGAQTRVYGIDGREIECAIDSVAPDTIRIAAPAYGIYFVEHRGRVNKYVFDGRRTRAEYEKGFTAVFVKKDEKEIPGAPR